MELTLTVFLVAFLTLVQLATSCWPPYLDLELLHNRTRLDEVIEERKYNPAAG
jgi:hypothetical protein